MPDPLSLFFTTGISLTLESWSRHPLNPIWGESGEWGRISILFRLTLHQINYHRKQVIPGLNSHSGTSDIANNNIDAGSRRPEIDRWHGAELWRSLLVRHPLPFHLCHLRIRFCYLHGRFVDPLEEGMNTHARRNAYLNLIPHPLSYS